MNAGLASHCQYHPERPGVGVCVRCRTVICTECTTRFDGINHCAVCVAGLVRDERRDKRPPSAVLTWLGTTALAGLIALSAYGLLHMLLLW